MNILFWLVVAGFAATLAWLVWYVRRKAEERRLAEDARAAAFMTGLAAAPRSTVGNGTGVAPFPAPAPTQPSSAPASEIAQQKLLFEAAHKAGEAGEPSLAIQLYARLLARYPSSAFSEQARAGAEAQKKKLVKA
jgi:hypothetical protein